VPSIEKQRHAELVPTRRQNVAHCYEAEIPPVFPILSPALFLQF